MIRETPRLRLEHLTEADDAFILELLNERGFIENIGDKEVRSLADAVAYVVSGPRVSYAVNGYGLYRVSLQPDLIPIGICGLVRRESLPGPDLGYAFLERFWGHGYAREAATDGIAQAAELGLSRLLAVTTPTNTRSIHLLISLGFTFERPFSLGPTREAGNLYALDLQTKSSCDQTR